MNRKIAFFLMTSIAFFLHAKAFSQAEVAPPQGGYEVNGVEFEVKALDSSLARTEFVDLFVESYLAVYRQLELDIGSPVEPQTLRSRPEDDQAKIDWLTAVAHEEYDAYILQPQPGSVALGFLMAGKLEGVVMLRLNDDGKSIYLGQGCGRSDYLRHGIGSWFISRYLPSAFPERSSYHVLVRHQNLPAIRFYRHLGFTAAQEVVEVYGYLPSRYLGFRKDF